MLDPNIICALIGIVFTLLTLDVMMNFYKKVLIYTNDNVKRAYHFCVKKHKRNNLDIIFSDF